MRLFTFYAFSVKTCEDSCYAMHHYYYFFTPGGLNVRTPSAGRSLCYGMLQGSAAAAAAVRLPQRGRQGTAGEL